ncbi:MAG: thioredoxin domain-containing protein, partial [Candidatus Puniceispirillum sp.]
ADSKSGSLSIVKLNIDENPLTPQKYNVRGIPTLLLFKNGEVVAEKVGALPKSQLESWIDQSI